MRRLRIAVCLYFVLSCVVFAVYFGKSRMVEDHTPPVITCDEDTVSASVGDGEDIILKGVTAKDDKDGNITGQVRISSMSHFIEKGKRTVDYIVFDKANHAGTAQRTLVYTDYVPPKIHLTKALRYSASEMSGVNLLENVTAEDCLDGDLTNQVRTTLGDDFYRYEPGEYPVTLQVSNSAGDVCSVQVDVVVTDNTDRYEIDKFYPMLSEYIAYTAVGTEIDPGAYLIGVERGNAEYLFEEGGANTDVGADDISIQSNVDYSQAGVYTVEYSYTSKNGGTAVTKLYVVVEE